MEEKIALAEDNQQYHKEKLKSDSKNIIDNIQALVGELEQNFNDDSKFYELLRIIHGRFSKIELNLNELEKLKNVGI